MGVLEDELIRAQDAAVERAIGESLQEYLNSEVEKEQLQVSRIRMDLNLANVKVNRKFYCVEGVEFITASIIRAIEGVDETYDVWQELPGQCDKKLEDGESLPHFPDSLRRFFVAPKFINNSACKMCTERRRL